MTLATVRRNTERIRELSALPFLLVAAVSIAGAVFRPAPQAVTGGAISAGDVAWMLTATGLVLLMTPGLSFFYGGMVGSKNVVSTMLQSFVAMAVISLLWVVVGFSLAFGDSLDGLIGDPRTFFMFTRRRRRRRIPTSAPTIPLMLFALFQLKFAIITPALITGSFAERVRFSATCCSWCLFSLFIYCAAGALDVASGRASCASGACWTSPAARSCTCRPASRRWPARWSWAGARCHLDERSRTRRRTSRSSCSGPACCGSAGSASTPARRWRPSAQAAMAFATTNTASAAAMLGWIVFDWMRGRKPSALGACVGAVVGPGGDHARGRLRHASARASSSGSCASVGQQPAVHWKNALDARRHARRLPLPRRRRHGGHAADRRLRQGRRPDVRPDATTFLVHCGALVFVAAFSFVRLVPALQAHGPHHPAARHRASRRRSGST